MFFEVWGYPWRLRGATFEKRWKKGSILTFPGRPMGPFWGAFSASVPLWDALGTLKRRSLEGFRSNITFLIKHWWKEEAFGTLKTLIICVRGCKNHVFGYTRFFIILGTTLEVILEPKMHPKLPCDSFWPPLIAILTLPGSNQKNNKKHRKSGSPK